ncbi:hypothetical protein ABS311_20855 [Catenovulum sediminis]|uniref:Ribbon-helix-helix protein CopG domain-containing protein n=2 Tax=Catenovulum sediminis TaxID=1740262 RepID=A0ABV1RN14_9ALTE|nr:hypothetical protein [Catenovulum sediminis]
MAKSDKAKWASSNKAIKAVQVAFDMDEKLQYVIRKEALDAGLGPSDQIRKILQLPVSKRPKRPRLTVSLSAEDYIELAKRYGLEAEDQLEIKKRVMDDLIKHASDGEQKS